MKPYNQGKAYTKNNDTHKDSTFIPAGSTVAVQMDNNGPWTHGMIIDGSNKDHWGWSYWVWVKKMGRVIRQNMKHIGHTPGTVEQYLRDQIAKTRAKMPAAFMALWQNKTLCHFLQSIYAHVHKPGPIYETD